MRYYVRHGIEIRTENSAKPSKQSSTFIEGEIRNLCKVESSVNYGAGKLRFLDAMTAVSNVVTLVDSEIQIERKQNLLERHHSNYYDVIRNKNNINSKNVRQFIDEDTIYDRAYCLNVLAIVPFPSIRKDIFLRCFKKLRSGGDMIVVNRWRNSDFDNIRARDSARELNGGILIKSYRGYGYYYQMKSDEAEKLGTATGFLVRSLKRKDGTYFLVLRKP